jgi:DnaK suppressor protein
MSEQSDGEDAPIDLAGAERRLGEIEGALERLEQGTYGQCSSCGGPIADADLEADAARSLCASCSAGREG